MRQAHKKDDKRNPKPTEFFNTSNSGLIFIIQNLKHET